MSQVASPRCCAMVRTAKYSTGCATDVIYARCKKRALNNYCKEHQDVGVIDGNSCGHTDDLDAALTCDDAINALGISAARTAEDRLFGIPAEDGDER